jgi:hypothetical protein
MLVILFGRVMPTDENHHLYIVIKTINNIKSIRATLKKEQNCLARSVKMIKPVLVGEYDLNRHDVYNHCKEDVLLSKDLNTKLFVNWLFIIEKQNKCAIKTFYDHLLDIKMRLQFVLKKREMNYPLYFDDMLSKNIIEKNGFIIVRKYYSIEEE